jgi:phosphate transport system substrate-binding protein
MDMTKKYLLGLMATAAILTTAACSKGGEAATGSGKSDSIVVVSREEGSGTRSAFEELVGVNADADHMMTGSASIKDGNGTVATDIAAKESAIGYVSFSTLDENQDKVKGLRINGVEPTNENVLNDTYQLKRPFTAVFKEDKLSDVDKAFLEYLASEDGQLALQDADGIVDLTNATAFDMAKYKGLSGTLKMGGSTSTEHAINAVASEFTAMFPGVTYTYDATGSGAGITGATEGTYGIGFISRELKDSEASVLSSEIICQDGIAMIVNPKNTLNDVTLDQVREIYLGNVANWSEVK